MRYLIAIMCSVIFLGQMSQTTFAQSNTPLNWQILGDVSAKYEHTELKPASFVLGDVDFWFQKQINPQWAAMGEIMLMEMGASGEPMYHFHPMRLFIEYQQSEKFKLRIGQMHTPIGYYNQLYPHGGKFFEPTIHRPHLARVTTGTEILSYHTVGLNARGTINLNKSWDFQYIVGIGNGDPHAGIDKNSFKSPYFQLGLQPLDIDGLSFNTSLYLNEIKDPADTTNYDLREIVGTLGVLYEAYPVDLLAEFFVIGHGESFSSIIDQTSLNGQIPFTSLIGGYLQSSYSINEQALFIQVEAYQRDKEDLWIDGHTDHEKHFGVHWGHRYLINQGLVLKTGHAYDWANNLHRFDMQLAYRL